IRRAFSRKHDTLLAYTKSSRYTFNADAVRVPYDPSTLKAFASSRKAGFGKTPDLARGKVPEDWWVLPVVARLHKERTGYPTQKPFALLERIILASSRPGDLVADFFCGSGTALAAAAKHGRRWLGCDRAAPACATTYRRMLLELPAEGVRWEAAGPPPPADLRPFVRVAVEGSMVRARLVGRRPFQWFEADWLYRETTFHSRSRTARPWRDAAPLDSLTLRAGRPGRRRVAFRAADAAGRIYLTDFVLRVPAR
ncbi:MAG TPA: site-specific DNA-methyltransferase, partial [Anaerolineales bacterium]|nr:site-specific DNA-methyltransferase [Anaerolineales bacterium]